MFPTISFSGDFPFTVMVPPVVSSVENRATADKGDVPYGFTTINAFSSGYLLSNSDLNASSI